MRKILAVCLIPIWARLAQAQGAPSILQNAWTQSYSGGFAFAVTRDPYDNFFVAGQRNGKAWVAKLDSLGNLVWEYPNSGTVGGGTSGICHSIKTDSSGVLFGVCSASSGPNANQCYLQPLTPTVGEPIGSLSWTDPNCIASTAGGASAGPQATIAIDLNNDIHIAATDARGGIYTVKLKRADASVLWQKMIPGQTFHDLAVDSSKVWVVAETPASVFVDSATNLLGGTFSGHSVPFLGAGLNRKHWLFDTGSTLYAGGSFSTSPGGLWLQKISVGNPDTIVFTKTINSTDIGPDGNPVAVQYSHSSDQVNLCGIPWFVSGNRTDSRAFLGGFSTGDGSFQGQAQNTPVAVIYSQASAPGEIVIAGYSGGNIHISEWVQSGSCNAAIAPGPAIAVAVVVVVAVGGGGGGSGGGGTCLEGNGCPPAPTPPSYPSQSLETGCQGTVLAYPNPVPKGQYLNITWLQGSNYTVPLTLWDLAGQKVASASVNGQAGQNHFFWFLHNGSGKTVQGHSMYHLKVGSCDIPVGVK